MLIDNDNSPCVQLFIFVALACEAKPLVQFFDLKKDPAIRPFSIYKRGPVVLTVAGVGKVAMGGAVAYSLARFNHTSNPALLNVGIAGHKTEPVGALFRVMKIIDRDTANVYFPPIIAKNVPPTCVLTTVSKPAKQYQADMLYDMEAAAFYEMAVRFSSSEWVQCIKIVSDNEQSPVENINAKQVQQWITQQMRGIECVVKDLLSLSTVAMQIEPEGYQQMLEQWHFTVSQQIRLRALLLRRGVLTEGGRFTFDSDELKNAKQLLKKLETELDQLVFFL